MQTTVQHPSEMCRPITTPVSGLLHSRSCADCYRKIPAQLCLQGISFAKEIFVFTHPPSPRIYSHKSPPPTSHSHSESFPGLQHSRRFQHASSPEINRTIVFKQYLRVLKVNHTVQHYVESEPEKSHVVI